MPKVPPVETPNHLLQALPPRERPRMLGRFEPVELTFGQCLLEPGERLREVYFPTGCAILLVLPLERGAALEVGLVGDEGMWSVGVPLGAEVSPLRVIVQGAGPALRMEIQAFRRELQASPALQRLMQNYAGVVLQQRAQAVACAHFHVVEARLARWLLMTRDRAHADGFHLTHEFLAYLLGVRRVGVTIAASALQRRRLITYHRGDIVIIDGEGLELASCGCYRADLRSYAPLPP